MAVYTFPVEVHLPDALADAGSAQNVRYVLLPA